MGQASGADGQLSYDDFGEVTVSAASTACFPGMKFPASPTDQRAVQDFLLQFGLTHPVVRDMRDAKAFTSGGSVVVFLHGTVAFQVPGDELSRRLSIAMAVTSRRGYLLTWFFAAPHDSELKELLDERSPSMPSRRPKKPAPPNREAAKFSRSPATRSSSNCSCCLDDQPAASLLKRQARISQPEALQQLPCAAAAATQPDAPAASASSRPSLLRPGETMQDQQVNGKPLPRRA